MNFIPTSHHDEFLLYRRKGKKSLIYEKKIQIFLKKKDDHSYLTGNNSLRNYKLSVTEDGLTAETVLTKNFLVELAHFLPYI